MYKTKYGILKLNASNKTKLNIDIIKINIFLLFYNAYI